jgi:hypothetical protein
VQVEKQMAGINLPQPACENGVSFAAHASPPSGSGGDAAPPDFFFFFFR